MHGHMWARCHSSVGDMTDHEFALVVAERYRSSEQWARYNISVHVAYGGKYFIAGQLKSKADLSAAKA